jgi:murein DD-endopeptidase MepM/ murein hydrolase activator NlpD
MQILSACLSTHSREQNYILFYRQCWPAGRRLQIAGLVLALGIGNSSAGQAQTPKLILPTENRGLLTGDQPSFYQYIRRDFEGTREDVWEGGQYGFVRDPRRIGSEVIYTRFHEGIDIRPLHRDQNGEPVDVIGAIADGDVVYANSDPAGSNYGRYVVVEHMLDGCPYFSLSAHLKLITTSVGTHVHQGDPIAVMGYSGEGIDRTRAHVHLEINLMLSGSFDVWYAKHYRAEANRHGSFNGINLAGIDIGRFYLALQKNPALTIPEFLSSEPIWYRVRVPASGAMDILQRYPWLSDGKVDAKAWEISFSQSGLPLNFRAVDEPPSAPVLSWSMPSAVPLQLLTRGYLRGSGASAQLTVEGLKYVELISPGS